MKPRENSIEHAEASRPSQAMSRIDELLIKWDLMAIAHMGPKGHKAVQSLRESCGPDGKPDNIPNDQRHLLEEHHLIHIDFSTPDVIDLTKPIPKETHLAGHVIIDPPVRKAVIAAVKLEPALVP